MDRRSFLAGAAATAGVAAMGLPALAPVKERMVSVLVTDFSGPGNGYTGFVWRRIPFSKMIMGDVAKFDDEGDAEFRVMKAPYQSENFTHDGKPVQEVSLMKVGEDGLPRKVTARMTPEFARAYKDLFDFDVQDWRIL